MSIPRLPQLPRGPKAPSVGPLRRRSEVADRRVPPQLDPGRERTYPAPPPDWGESEGAWALYWAHGTGRLDRGPEGELWSFQRPFFGSVWTIGFVPDFVEYDLNITIDVLDPARTGGLGRARAIQLLRQIILQRFNFTHVAMREETAQAAPIWALREALAGRSPDGGLG